jgi:hypothetical protein
LRYAIQGTLPWQPITIGGLAEEGKRLLAQRGRWLTRTEWPLWRKADIRLSLDGVARSAGPILMTRNARTHRVKIILGEKASTPWQSIPAPVPWFRLMRC